MKKTRCASSETGEGLPVLRAEGGPVWPECSQQEGKVGRKQLLSDHQALKPIAWSLKDTF